MNRLFALGKWACIGAFWALCIYFMGWWTVLALLLAGASAVFMVAGE